jgi:fido (protein-threonine AMPylation protein)
MLLLPDLLQRIENLDNEITKFRNGGELDQLSKEKLREYFRTQHIYHSAGIEGNRLTLQETMLVLKEGITISEKSIQDTVEVKNLGIAFDFFYELAQQNIPITENYLKQIHQLVVGNDPYLNAGNYRNVGVIITGSAHTPPEPFEIQFKMQELMDWLNDNYEQENPIILAAVVHHELAKIHPFSDGNGRTARLLLNLILMKKGYPICSIKRTERPRYYEAMSDADNGNYHQIVELVAENCYELFAQYIRIREESNRKTLWAKKWGKQDVDGKLRKEKGRFELWLNRMNQIKLEFRQAVDLLNDSLETYNITYYEYPSITFETFQDLEDKGYSQNTFFFSIRIFNKETKRIVQTFVFRFFRDRNKFESGNELIHLELNCFNPETKSFLVIEKFPWADRVQLRSFFFNNNVMTVSQYERLKRKIVDIENPKQNEVVETFFDDVLKNVIGV